MRKTITVILTVILSLLSLVPTVTAGNTTVYYECADFTMNATCELRGDYPKLRKFIFEVKVISDEYSPSFEKSIINVPANFTCSFGTIKADRPDTYSYIVEQTVGKNSKITYDKTKFKVVVDVISNAEGLVTENHTITNLSTGEKVDEIRFINIYESNSPPTNDDSNLYFWIALLIILSISGVGVLIALIVTKRKAVKK